MGLRLMRVRITEGLGGPIAARVLARSVPEGLACYLRERRQRPQEVTEDDLVDALAAGYLDGHRALLHEDWRHRTTAYIDRLPSGEVEAVIVAEVEDGDAGRPR